MRKPAPNYKVRTDPGHRTLDSMIGIANPSQMGGYTESSLEGEEPGRPSKRRAIPPPGTAEEPFELDDDDASVAALSDDEAVDEQTPRPGESSGKGKGKEKEIPESRCELTSVAELRRTARKAGHSGEFSAVQSPRSSNADVGRND